MQLDFVSAVVDAGVQRRCAGTTVFGVGGCVCEGLWHCGLPCLGELRESMSVGRRWDGKLRQHINQLGINRLGRMEKCCVLLRQSPGELFSGHTAAYCPLMRAKSVGKNTGKGRGGVHVLLSRML